MSYIDRKRLEQLISGLQASFTRPGRLYLVGETGQVFESWRSWTEQVEFTAETAPAEFKRKYKGLLQMWRAVRPCTTHRHSPA